MSNLFFITLIPASLLHTFNIVGPIFDLYRTLLDWAKGFEVLDLFPTNLEWRLKSIVDLHFLIFQILIESH